MNRLTMTGAILAGGASSRFGANKALAMFRGRPLISLITDKISSLFSSTLLITNSPLEYAFLDITMNADIYPGAGPLAGIHTALSATSSAYTFICACDMPLLSEKLIRYLAGFTPSSSFDIIVPVSEKGPEPLHSFYHRRLIGPIETLITSGEKKVSALFESPKTAVKLVPMDEILAVTGNMNSFFNINHQDDLASLDRIVHDMEMEPLVK